MPSTSLERIKRLAWLLDNSLPIPGTGWRIGLDPLLGLIPGLGDLIGAVLSSWILLAGYRLGASRPTLVRMFWNVLVETVLGAIPMLGDIFDAAWKANAKNVALLERHLATPDLQRRQDRVFVGMLLGGLFVGTGGAVALGFLMARWLLRIL